jgi:hypothetical protein
LTARDALNYVLTQPSGLSADVTKANLAVTGVTAVNRTYDSTAVATLGGTAAVTGFVGDTVSVSGTGAGAFANPNAGVAQARDGQRLQPERAGCDELQRAATCGCNS